MNKETKKTVNIDPWTKSLKGLMESTDENALVLAWCLMSMTSRTLFIRWIRITPMIKYYKELDLPIKRFGRVSTILTNRNLWTSEELKEWERGYSEDSYRVLKTYKEQRYGKTND